MRRAKGSGYRRTFWFVGRDVCGVVQALSPLLTTRQQAAHMLAEYRTRHADAAVFRAQVSWLRRQPAPVQTIKGDWTTWPAFSL